MAGETTRTAGEASGVQGMTVGGVLMLSVLPLLALVFALGAVVVWGMIVFDPTPGLSPVKGLAVVLGLLVVGTVARALQVIRRRSDYVVARIGELTATARRIAEQDLTMLGESLDHPDPTLAPIAPIELTRDAPAEVIELSRSLEELHVSLQQVAARQMASLQGGVSSLIVSLTRRNASLVDRQLALLDELEKGERDPDVLGTYYMLDHYAARIRRNAESLLVLAGEPPPRVWPRSMAISEVVRAAVGEVDEYQRVEIGSLERARIVGGAVADLAHLLAELLDNATRFSPEGTPVEVTSVFDWDGYRLTVTDRGSGLTNQRIRDLNQILKHPPALGRVMEPTSGIYVVARLAARHGMTVEIIPGIPGLTVQVTIPADILEHRLSDFSAAKPVTSQTRPDPAPEPAAIVVDLTDPALGGEPAETGPTPVGEPGSLPVRSPGQALGEAPDLSPVAKGERAQGIRAALAAYDRGRRAATQADLATDHPEEDPDE